MDRGGAHQFVKYTVFLNPLKGPGGGGGGGGGKPPMLVGVGSLVLVGTEFPVVIPPLPPLVGVMLTLVRVVDDIVVLSPELLVSTGDVSVGVLTTSVVLVLELVDIPIVIEEDEATIQEAPIAFGA